MIKATNKDDFYLSLDDALSTSVSGAILLNEFSREGQALKNLVANANDVKNVVNNVTHYAATTMALVRQHFKVAQAFVADVMKRPETIQESLDQLIGQTQPLTPKANLLREINIHITGSKIPNDDISQTHKKELANKLLELMGADDHTKKKMEWHLTDEKGRYTDVDKLIENLIKLQDHKQYFGERVSREDKRAWELKKAESTKVSYTQDPVTHVTEQSQVEKMEVSGRGQTL